MIIHLPESAAMLIDRLESKGYEAYVVGGCVRDALLHTKPHDWDITTNAMPHEVKAALPDLHFIDTGLKHGTLTVCLETLYEVTTFRVDGRYSDGRHPDRVMFSRTLVDDLSRRDFTINAMAYNPLRGLVDVFGGREDLHNGIIRCVGNAKDRMSEDALRIMRAVRFQSELGFSIAPETKQAIDELIPFLSRISAERIGSEFQRIVSAPHAAFAIRENKDVFFSLVPALRTINDDGVFEHTLSVLEAAKCERGVFPAGWSDTQVGFALLLENISKHYSLAPEDKGQTSYSERSALIARDVMKSLRYSNQLINDVGELVALHDAVLTPHRPEVRRWLMRLNDNQLKRLLKIKECEIAVQNDKSRFDGIVQFWNLARRLKAEHIPLSTRELAVDGKALMDNGIPPGKRMGFILKKLLEDVTNEKVPNEKEKLLHRAQELSNIKEM